MPSRSMFSLIAPFIAGLTFTVALAGAPKQASASNFKIAGAHIQSIHYSGAGWNERWCTDVRYSTYSLSNALTVINAAYTGGGSGDWHGVANSKIYLADALYGQCFDSANWQSSFRLINQVVSNALSDQYCGGTSCQFKLYGWSCNPYCHWYSSHQFYRQSYMEQYPLQIHVVNHETGHVFGFDDPAYQGDCSAQSVMHTIFYRCSTNYTFPTQLDRDTLTVVASQPNY